MARDFGQCVSSAINPALRSEQPHLGQKLLSTPGQAFLYPGGLQRHQCEAVPAKERAETISQARAQSALGVEANPAVSILYICNFCSHRNTFQKKDRAL